MSSAALSGAPPGVTSPEQELIRRLGDGTAFVSIGAWRIAAPNRSTIQKALAELTERHHVLRPAEASNPVLAVEWREWMPDNGDPEPLIRAMFDEIRAAASAGNIRSPLRAVVAATEPERSVLALAAPATSADCATLPLKSPLSAVAESREPQVPRCNMTDMRRSGASFSRRQRAATGGAIGPHGPSRTPPARCCSARRTRSHRYDLHHGRFIGGWPKRYCRR